MEVESEVDQVVVVAAQVVWVVVQKLELEVKDDDLVHYVAVSASP